MTSDRDLSPDLQQRLVGFSDRVFSGRHASDSGLDPALTEAVRKLKAEDRVPSYDSRRVQTRKEELMRLATATVVPGVLPGSGITIPELNGRIPRPPAEVRAPRISGRRVMQAVSFLVLIGILAGIAYGLFEYRDSRNSLVPAVQETQTSETGAPIGTPWGQFRGGPERTGYTADPGPGGDLTLRWSFTAEESLNGIMQAEGKVFAYGAEGGLYAIDAGTGEQVWAIDFSAGSAGDPGLSKLAAVADGVAYISTLEGSLIAVDAESGDVNWQLSPTGGALSAPTVAAGLVFVVVDQIKLLALDPSSGEEEWSVDLPATITNQYPTVVEGTLFIADDAAVVRGIDIETGELVWSSEAIAAHRVSAYSDERLFVPGVDGRLTALDAATGAVLWATEPTKTEGLNPIATGTAIIVAAENARVKALNPETGEVLWTSDQPNWGTNSPHAGGSTVYVRSGESAYAALSLADGSVLGTTDQAAGAGSTAAISGELLFVSGLEGTVRAFGPVEGESNVVVASPLASVATHEGEGATGETEQMTIDAPPAGDMHADLVYSFQYPEGRFPAGVFEDPEGRLWSLVFDSGEIDVYDRDFNLVESWAYGRGEEPSQFDWFATTESWVAGGIVWTSDGTAHITDMGNARIQMVGPDGTLLGSWGSKGDGDGQFQNPVAIALTAENEFVVADLERSDVQWFDQNGNFLRRLAGPDDDSPFGRPVDIKIDPDGNLWVLDGVGLLHKFDENNQLLLSIGHVFEHVSPGQFRDPCCIDIDENGLVWVADQWNRRIQVFDPNGNLLAVWDGCNTEAGCLMNTTYLVLAGNGFFYITDWDENGLQPAHMHKFHLTNMPEIPIMPAATPAAD